MFAMVNDSEANGVPFPADPHRVRAGFIRRIRLQRGLRQTDLAELAGISRQHILNIENGANFSIEVLLRIANALGVEPEELYPQDDPGGSRATQWDLMNGHDASLLFYLGLARMRDRLACVREPGAVVPPRLRGEVAKLDREIDRAMLLLTPSPLPLAAHRKEFLGELLRLPTRYSTMMKKLGKYISARVRSEE